MFWLLSVLLAFMLAFFCLATFGLLKNNKKASDVVLLVIAVYLFAYKVAEYIYWQAIGRQYNLPIEFSAVSYFVFAIAIITRSKPITNVASFFAPMAGVFYYLGVIAAPQTFFDGNDGIFFFTMAVINHGVLFFGGLILLATKKPDKHYLWQIPLATAMLVGYSYLMVFLANPPNSIMFIDIVEGRLLDGLVAPFSGFLIIYYIFLFGIYGLLIWLFYLFNKRCLHGKIREKREKKMKI